MLFALVLPVLTIFLGGYYYLSTNSGFELGSSSSISRQALEEHGTVFFGYQFYFEGYGTPTIENIYLVQRDGTINRQNNNQISITPFIDLSKQIGVLEESYVMEEGIIKELAPIQGFKFKNNHYNVAFKVELKDENFDQDFQAFIVEYRHLGIRKEQSIDFEGFFTNDTAVSMK